MKRLFVRLSLLTVALAAAPCVGAGDGPLDRATLRGLKSLGVAIDPLSAALEERGLAAAALKTQIERRLQEAGIPVDADATEFVGIRIMSAQARRTPFAISISLGVYQKVDLARDNGIKTATETWGVQSVLLSQPNQVSESVSETIDQLVQQFVNGYRSVNPQ